MLLIEPLHDLLPQCFGEILLSNFQHRETQQKRVGVLRGLGVEDNVGLVEFGDIEEAFIRLDNIVLLVNLVEINELQMLVLRVCAHDVGGIHLSMNEV